MPKKTGVTTKDRLREAPLPQATQSYTVISHDFVMQAVETELAKVNLQIEKELYKSSASGEVASGLLQLGAGDDNEMKMMFAWVNSYDKSKRFKCAIGGYLVESGNAIVSGNMGSWGRKHTGNADQETISTIAHQIQHADMYYGQLVKDKAMMKDVILSQRDRANALGILFFEHNLLTSEQANLVKQQIKKPSYKYSADKDSLWTLYCNITYSLQRSHPKTWLDQQLLIHFFLTDHFNISNPIDVPPPVPAAETPAPGHQMTIHDVIAEEEALNQIQM